MLAASQLQAPDSGRMEIPVPMGAVAGTSLTVSTPDGGKLKLTIPPNVPPGANLVLIREKSGWTCSAVWDDGVCQDNAPSGRRSYIPSIQGSTPSLLGSTFRLLRPALSYLPPERTPTLKRTLSFGDRPHLTSYANRVGPFVPKCSPLAPSTPCNTLTPTSRPISGLHPALADCFVPQGRTEASPKNMPGLSVCAPQTLGTGFPPGALTGGTPRDVKTLAWPLRPFVPVNEMKPLGSRFGAPPPSCRVPARLPLRSFSTPMDFVRTLPGLCQTSIQPQFAQASTGVQEKNDTKEDAKQTENIAQRQWSGESVSTSQRTQSEYEKEDRHAASNVELSSAQFSTASSAAKIYPTDYPVTASQTAPAPIVIATHAYGIPAQPVQIGSDPAGASQASQLGGPAPASQAQEGIPMTAQLMRENDPAGASQVSQPGGHAMASHPAEASQAQDGIPITAQPLQSNDPAGASQVSQLGGHAMASHPAEASQAQGVQIETQLMQGNYQVGVSQVSQPGGHATASHPAETRQAQGIPITAQPLRSHDPAGASQVSQLGGYTIASHPAETRQAQGIPITAQPLQSHDPAEASQISQPARPEVSSSLAGLGPNTPGIRHIQTTPRISPVGVSLVVQPSKSVDLQVIQPSQPQAQSFARTQQFGAPHVFNSGSVRRLVSDATSETPLTSNALRINTPTGSMLSPTTGTKPFRTQLLRTDFGTMNQPRTGLPPNMQQQWPGKLASRLETSNALQGQWFTPRSMNNGHHA